MAEPGTRISPIAAEMESNEAMVFLVVNTELVGFSQARKIENRDSSKSFLTILLLLCFTMFCRLKATAREGCWPWDEDWRGWPTT